MLKVLQISTGKQHSIINLDSIKSIEVFIFGKESENDYFDLTFIKDLILDHITEDNKNG